MSPLPHPEPMRCALPSWHRGCRAPARRVHGRRVRYVIGAEPGQVNGMRWRTGPAQQSEPRPPHHPAREGAR
ncbi:tryptophan biosynthesis modulator TrpM [Streptomyces sp. NBC_01420]|uniref:tryptophan biosynthesis modulator TrpM n=1 Tax=unclassified Streptomyces TaxID=2593676 RepID=UPI00089A0076|nr:hypothetical protein SAMN05216483_4833 [Streptomyces sp. 2131.1]